MRNIPSVLVAVLTSILFISPDARGGGVFPSPEPVSPGAPETVRLIADRCPTFSWSGVPGAWGYEIAIFSAVEAAVDVEPAVDGTVAERPIAIDPDSTEPLVRARVPAGTSSWTPALEQCLVQGREYSWFIRETASPGRSEGAWSAASLFEVDPAAEPWEETELALDELIERLEELGVRIGEQGGDDSTITVEGIWDTLDQVREWLIDNFQPVEDNLGWKITQARNHANAARSHAHTIQTWTTHVGDPSTLGSAAADLKQIFEDGRELLDGPSALSVSVEGTAEPYSSHLFENRPVRDFVASGVEVMRDFAENELADAEKFMASPSGESCGSGSVCANFRKELSVLFTSAEEVINGVAGLGGVAHQSADAPLQSLETDIQLDLVISLLQRLPGRVLYVLYRVNESIGFTERAKRLQEAAEGLELVAPLFSQTSSSAMKGVGTSAVDTCSLVDGQEQVYSGLATGLVGVGLLSRAIGTILEAIGETKIGGEGGVAVANAKIQTSPAKKVGIVFNGIGAGLTSVGSTVFQALNRCRLFGDHEDLKALIVDVNGDNKLDQLALIHDLHFDENDVNKLDLILGEVKVRTDALEHQITTLGSRLDSATESSQTLIWKLAIESNLQANSADAIGAFVLPAPWGHLETVRDIVRNTIDGMAAIGENTREAEKWFARGSSDFDAGQYKNAYKDFQKAYSAALETSGGVDVHD